MPCTCIRVPTERGLFFHFQQKLSTLQNNRQVLRILQSQQPDNPSP